MAVVRLSFIGGLLLLLIAIASPGSLKPCQMAWQCYQSCVGILYKDHRFVFSFALVFFLRLWYESIRASRGAEGGNIGLTHHVQNSRYCFAPKKPGTVSFLTSHRVWLLSPQGSAGALVAIGDSLLIGPSHLPSPLALLYLIYQWGLSQWSCGPNSYFSSQTCPCGMVLQCLMSMSSPRTSFQCLLLNATNHTIQFIHPTIRSINTFKLKSFGS